MYSGKTVKNGLVAVLKVWKEGLRIGRLAPLCVLIFKMTKKRANLSRHLSPIHKIYAEILKVGKRNREVGLTAREPRRIQERKRNNRQYRLETPDIQGKKRGEESVFNLRILKSGI